MTGFGVNAEVGVFAEAGYLPRRSNGVLACWFHGCLVADDEQEQNHVIQHSQPCELGGFLQIESVTFVGLPRWQADGPRSMVVSWAGLKVSWASATDAAVSGMRRQLSDGDSANRDSTNRNAKSPF